MGNSPVTGEFPTSRPVTRTFDVFFDLRVNRRLRKQWWGWWFDTLWCPLLRHCKVYKRCWDASRVFSNKEPYVFSCDLAALQMVFSVRPSVCPSVRHTFLTMFPSSYHHEIFRSYYQWQKWRPCKTSRSEVKGQGHRGHNPTLPFPDSNSSLNSCMLMKWCI